MANADDLEKAPEKSSHSEDLTTVTSDEDVPPAVALKRRIRYIDDDDAITIDRVNTQAGDFGHTLQRRASSFSIHSVQSMRNGLRTIDPALALPIQYRTLSFNISQSKDRPEQEVPDLEKAKKKAVVDLEDLDWHLIPLKAIYSRLETDPSSGLSSTEATAFLSKYGPNKPSPPPSRLASKLFSYFFGGFGSILLIGCILVFISWRPLGEPNPSLANLALAIVLAVVFFVQAAFNAWQDFSTSRVMNSITGMLPEDCTVLRNNGEKIRISAEQIVPGDVLCFRAGDKLCADIRFFDVSSDAKFDRSILTGESIPVASVTESSETNYLETRCIGMQGTHCTSGSGLGVVVATGDNTVFGHIAKLTSTPSTAMTTLQKEILRFVLIIVTLMLLMDIIVIGMWAGYIRTNYPDYMPVSVLIINIVSVAIAFVPEGLPIALTASLTITANVMRNNNVLCKSLKTVETLGSVSVLLSDKTGTLTKNQMVATDCLIGFTAIGAAEAVKEIEKSDTPTGISRSDDISDSSPEIQNITSAALHQLRIIGSVCNAGEFEPTTMHLPLAERRIIADATDQAVLRFSASLGSVAEARDLWRKRFDLAFNSKNKFALRIVSATNPSASAVSLSEEEASKFSIDKDMLLTIKGAPDVLISRCTQYVGEDGAIYPLDEGVRASIEATKDDWSNSGKRVLLLARKVLAAGTFEVDPDDGRFEIEADREARSGLVLVALIGIVDPPRDEIPEVVETLRGAGIRTMMVTGDFKLTAQAIARACGIITNPPERVHSIENLSRYSNPETEKDRPQSPKDYMNGAVISLVISGPELMTLNDAQWETLTRYTEIVFARTTPDQKLRIVKEFQARANVVAMTGDGVNDAPSLKQADIGIAPGSGSDIAMEAADMILLESFSAIVVAVTSGRVVYDNLKKTIAYLLPAGTFSEFWPVMTSVIFGLPQVLSSFLMIIICCFTDCAAAIVLAYEPPEADVLQRPPRDVRKDHLVDWRFLLQTYGFIGIIETVTSFSMSFWYLQRNGIAFSSLWFSFGNVAYPDGMTSDEFSHHLSVASSIYFVNLVVMQWFSVMAIRTRRLSIFSHPPIGKRATSNWKLFPAILFALVIIFIFNYIPGLQSVIGSAQIPVEYWFFPMAFGLALLTFDELRKAGVRRWPKSLLAKMAW